MNNREKKHIIDDNQIYLFGKGELHYAYECFGSKISKDNVTFTLWVPDVKSVHLVGTFNNWQKDRKLEEIGDTGIWTSSFSDVKKGDLYKYLIETKDGKTFLKSDPFAFYSQLRPDTASIVYDFSYNWHDIEWMENRDVNSLGKPKNIYEVHLGSWKKNHDSSKQCEFLNYREITKDLVKYVKDMGYTHIELMPITEYPFDGSWGYQVTGYYSATSRYGTPEDLMYFIDYAHQNNIAVIMDWVPGHFCQDEHGLSNFNGKMLYENAIHPNWGTAKFDFGRPQVRSFLLSNANFWLSEYHFDGIRVDGVSSILYLNFGIDNPADKKFNKYGDEGDLEAISFLKDLSIMTGKYHPSATLMAEESTSWPLVTYPPENEGLGFNYKWDMGWMHDTLNYFQSDFPYRKFNHKFLTFSMMYAFSENFILPLSHDEIVHGKASLINKMPGDYWRKFAGLRVLMLYQLAHPGVKLNFMGSEIAQFDEWHEWEEISWQLVENYEMHRKFQYFIKKINHLYLKEPSLWREDHSWSGFEWIDANNSEQCVYIFRRISNYEKSSIYVAMNCEVNPIDDFRIGVEDSGTYLEILNTDNVEFGGSGIVNKSLIKAEKVPFHGKKYSITLRLPPLGAILFKRVYG